MIAGYPRVRALLERLPEEELTRAGQLLSRLDQQALRAAHPQLATVRVAITGHGTQVSLVPALTAQLARHGLVLDAYQAGYDSYVFALSDPDSDLYQARPELTLCLLDPAVITDELPLPWRPDDVAELFAAKLRLLEGLIGTFTAASSGLLALNTLPLPRQLPAQLLDLRSRARLGAGSAGGQRGAAAAPRGGRWW